jgi:hypothetical protein
MTDPVEDRLRDHFADRAARVTVPPDPEGLVNRPTGRARPGAALVAGLVAAVVVLVGGGFGTGLAVAGSRTSSVPPTSAVAPAASGAPSASTGAVSGIVPSRGTVGAVALTPLFTRTSASGVTIRAYTSSTGDKCAASSACPPVGVIPAPGPCPPNAMCAQPAVPPAVPPASAGSGSSGVATGGSGGAAGSTTSGSGTLVPGTVSSVPTGPVTGCQSLTLELSTDLAVATALIAAPTGSTGPPTGVTVLGSGTFGEPEGGPTGWVAVRAGTDVAALHLVSAAGVVADAMAPSSGVAVLAITGPDPLAGLAVAGLDPAGATVASVALDQATPAPTPSCLSVPPGPPTTTPTTSTTIPTSTTLPTTLPAPVPTTGPPTSTPRTPPSVVPVNGVG